MNFKQTLKQKHENLIIQYYHIKLKIVECDMRYAYEKILSISVLVCLRYVYRTRCNKFNKEEFFDRQDVFYF